LSYRIHYADGSSVEIPVKSGMQIGGWWGTPELTDAKIALEISNAKTSKINLQCYRWKNPHPEKELKSLDAVSAEGEGVPALVAATAEE
jgi:beta-galactosidase